MNFSMIIDPFGSKKCVSQLSCKYSVIYSSKQTWPTGLWPTGTKATVELILDKISEEWNFQYTYPLGIIDQCDKDMFELQCYLR